MSTRGFDQRMKSAIAGKIREMDQKLEEAKSAIERGDCARCRALLAEVEGMKVNELITLFPEVVMGNRQSDVPFSVFYEIFSGVFGELIEFMRWLSRERRKPRDQRDLDARQGWVIRLRRLLSELVYIRQLDWPAGNTGKDEIDELIERLRETIRMIEDLHHDNASEVMENEVGYNEFSRHSKRLLEVLSDPTFSLERAFSDLYSMDRSMEGVRESLHGLTTADEIDRGAAAANIRSAIDKKHRLARQIESATTAPDTQDGG